MSNVLTFVPPTLQPAEFEKKETREEREQRLIDAGLKTGVGEITFKPLLWERDLPSKAGFFFRRRPGASRITWKVIEVWQDDTADGELLAGWTDIVRRPLSTYTGWEFCGPLPEPYEPRGPRWGVGRE